MARTDIPVQTIGRNGGALNPISYTSGDATNDHEFVNDGKTLLLVKKGATGGVVVDIDAIADASGRTVDGGATVAVDTDGIFGPFKKNEWNQSGKINVNLDVDTNVTVAAIKYQDE